MRLARAHGGVDAGSCHAPPLSRLAMAGVPEHRPDEDALSRRLEHNRGELRDASVYRRARCRNRAARFQSVRHGDREDGKQRFERPEKLRSEEHTSELQSQMRIKYAVFCLIKKTKEDTY